MDARARAGRSGWTQGGRISYAFGNGAHWADDTAREGGASMARIAGMLGMIGITGADYVHRLFRLSSPIIMLALNACRKRHVRVVKYRGWRECDFVAVIRLVKVAVRVSVKPKAVLLFARPSVAVFCSSVHGIKAQRVVGYFEHFSF